MIEQVASGPITVANFSFVEDLAELKFPTVQRCQKMMEMRSVFSKMQVAKQELCKSTSDAC